MLWVMRPKEHQTPHSWRRFDFTCLSQRPRFWRCTPWVLFLLLLGVPVGASRPVPPDLARSDNLTPVLQLKLARAFSLAMEKIDAHATCRQLYADLGKDPRATLRVTRYFAAPMVEEQRLCRRGVSAYTVVGSPKIYLCRSFVRLPADRAAVVVLHEALHYAGMTEWPADPQALNSAGINRLVAKSCDL